MEHERFHLLMMDALDGELVAEQKAELESHLRTCPECRREWHAILAIDTLFRQAPLLSPAANFTQRTVAMLPNRRARLWAISIIYVLLLLSGILPVLLVVWAANTVVPVISQPVFIESVQRLWDQGTRLAGVIAGALFKGVGELIMQQPAILGWLLVLAGMVFVWSGVYQQLVSQPTAVSVRGNK
ncbi:MAG: zf-HC2 domain-containing protein [Ardenticatenaceae bacterium]|nr:zf-HC2 domain-containing protein [Anaerolineales bacterium]MCB9008116.1 zf-HC2 domain-containing protein [Ardenticatenaceae bacterium]